MKGKKKKKKERKKEVGRKAERRVMTVMSLMTDELVAWSIVACILYETGEDENSHGIS